MTGASARHRHMTKNIIPFARAQRSVKEVVEKFYQELDDIEEIVIIAKDRDGEWIFANSELENELEWIGSLYKFINKAILEDEDGFLGENSADFGENHGALDGLPVFPSAQWLAISLRRTRCASDLSEQPSAERQRDLPTVALKMDTTAQTPPFNRRE